ncbi:hypothetical protein F5I97DRAFT_1815765 [Phlebopus sp. FC_14]|nr:hypothetical protein F5I97DRAFT_1815765 [Phlebopus sp. FC_14]
MAKSISTYTLSHHLADQKARFLADQGRGWTLVMGNEAGDLDTLASSIGYAWLRSHESSNEDQQKSVALMTTSRVDFVLRAENVHALQLARITDPYPELLCPEDLPVSHQCTEYALVDHNNLQSNFASANAQVKAVLDHHEDEGKYLGSASPRIIEPAGSCASLVTRQNPPTPRPIPPELATLLLSAIMIDTQGLKKGGKALGVDRDAAAWLLRHSSLPDLAPAADGTGNINLSLPAEGALDTLTDHSLIRSLTDTLSTKKMAVSHLSTRDLLRRDYKEYTLNVSPSISVQPGPVKAGLATVPLPLSVYFASHPSSTMAESQAWMKERGLSILGVLTTYRGKKGVGKREEMWIVHESLADTADRQLALRLFRGLEADKQLRLKRVDFGPSNDFSFHADFTVRVYKQKNASATRKQIAPTLKQILEK